MLPRQQSNEIQREKFYLLMCSGSHTGQRLLSALEAAFVFVCATFVEASKSRCPLPSPPASKGPRLRQAAEQPEASQPRQRGEQQVSSAQATSLPFCN